MRMGRRTRDGGTARRSSKNQAAKSARRASSPVRAFQPGMWTPARRGVVLAASYAVRPYGIRSAMPMARALRLCPDLLVVPPRFERYSEVSEDVFRIFQAFTPEVEGLSLDEAFLDVTRSIALHGAP